MRSVKYVAMGAVLSVLLTAAPMVAAAPAEDATGTQSGVDTTSDTELEGGVGGGTPPQTADLTPTGVGRGIPTAPYALSYIQQTSMRPGGQGVVRAEVVASGSSTLMRDLRVQTQAPDGFKFAKPQVEAWQCQSSRGGKALDCSYRGTVTRGDSAGFNITVRPSDTLSVSQQRGRAQMLFGKATWSDGKRTWSDTGSGQVFVDPSIAVTLSETSPKRVTMMVSNASSAARVLQLRADIDNLQGERAGVVWRQLRGPKVTFTRPAKTSTTKGKVYQSALLPRNAKGADKLVFEVAVTSGGQTVRTRTHERVMSHQVAGPMSGRDKLIGKALRTVTPPANLSQLPTAKRPVRLSADISGPSSATQGREVALRLTGAATPARWTTQTGTGPVRAAGTGRAVVVTTPSIAEGTMLVTAHIVTATSAYSVTHTLVAKPAGPPGLGSDEDDKKNGELLCAVAEDLYKSANSVLKTAVEVKSKDGSVLSIKTGNNNITIPSNMVIKTKFGYNCDDKGVISFKNAALTASAGSEFTKVSGTLSKADGVSMSNLTWTVPTQLLSSLPKNVKELDLVGKISIPFDSDEAGKWGNISGKSNLQPYAVGDREFTGLALIPLPEGWEFNPKDGAQLNFFGDKKKAIADGSMALVQRATGPREDPKVATSSISLSLVRSKGKFADVQGMVDNVRILTTEDGGDLAVSGGFTFAVGETKDGQVELGAKCTDPKGASSTSCRIGEKVYFNDAKVTINPGRSLEGWGLAGTFTFGSAQPPSQSNGSTTVTLAAAGSYKNEKSWSLSVIADSKTKFEMGPGLGAGNFTGTIKRTKVSIDDTDTYPVLYEVAAKVSFENLGTVQAVDAGGKITNKCDKDQPHCKDTEVRLLVAAGVKVTLPSSGKDNTLNVQVSGEYNWDTKGITLKGRFDTTQPLGPEEWNIKAAEVYLARGGYGTCRSADDDDRPTTWNLGVAGSATMFGEPVNVSTQFGKEGSCVWGSIGKIDTGDGADNPDLAGGVASWTNYPKGAIVTPVDGKEVRIKANTATVTGKVRLPDELNSFLKSPTATLDFTAQVMGKFTGLDISVAYTVNGEVAASDTATSRFYFTEIKLGIKFDRSGALPTTGIYAGAAGMLWLKGDAGKGIPDSTTPVGAQLEIDGGAGGMVMTLSAGTTQPDVPNAFGQPGLVLHKLGVGATIRLLPLGGQLTFSAAATTPPSWKSSGLQPGSEVSLALSIGNIEPWCAVLEIGKQGSQSVALDVANRGFLTANWFKLLLAPAGCTVQTGAGTTEKIDPGMGFAFDGHLVGAPLTVALVVGLGDNFTMKGELNIPKLDLKVVTLSGADGTGPAKAFVDIDVAAKRYNASIDAGIVVGKPDWGLGAKLAIKGFIDTSAEDASRVELEAKGVSAIPPGQLKFDPLSVKVVVPKPGHSTKDTEGDIRARVFVGILGKDMLGADIKMSYQSQVLTEFGILIGADLDLWVGEVSGNLSFQYCMGDLAPGRYDSQLAACDKYTNPESASPAYRFRLAGLLRFLWWKKQYSWNIADQKGSGSHVKPLDPDKPSGNSGPTVDADYKGITPSYTFLANPANGAQKMLINRWEVWTYGMQPTAVTVAGKTYPPCSVVRVGTQSYNPTSGNEPAQLLPLLDPSAQAGCGLDVANVGAGDRDKAEVSIIKAVCLPDKCFTGNNDGKGEFTQNESTSTARGTLLTMLNRPPATLVPGSQLWWQGGDGRMQRVNAVDGGGWFGTFTDRPPYPPNAPSRPALGNFFTGDKLQWSEPVSGSDPSFTFTERGQLVTEEGFVLGAALAAAPKAGQEPFLQMMALGPVVYCGPTSDSGVLWKISGNQYLELRNCKAPTVSRFGREVYVES